MPDDRWRDLGRRAVACDAWRWLPGMAILGRKGSGWRYWGRGRVPYHLVQSGSLLLSTKPPTAGGPIVDYSHGRWQESDLHWLPRLDDPATLGCLLALVREAWGAPHMRTQHFADAVPRTSRWEVERGWYGPTDTHGHRRWFGATEAEALVAALEAAPDPEPT